MTYRTRTYIAGDWDGDSDAIGKLYQWNEGNKWSLDFVDAHGFNQCYDSSLPCTIKSSLSERMSRSKTFVLVVGNSTTKTRKGSCSYKDCGNKWYSFTRGEFICNVVGKSYSNDSFIDYECKLAYRYRNEVRIVVLYNAASIDKSKCPEILRNVGIHKEMKSFDLYWTQYYDYQKVRNAIEG